MPLLVCGAMAGASSAALSWDRHAVLTQWAFPGLSVPTKALLDQQVTASCPPVEKKRYRELAEKFKLNSDALVLPASLEHCVDGQKTELKRIYLDVASDDPDHGMDRDLPAAFDPKGERRWMGGSEGPSSQGFRHMFFAGWKWSQPIVTFQIPVHAVGRAPERAQLFAAHAKELLRANDSLWAVRVLGWALHYVQDLAQPFHAVQIPNLRMVPWGSLWAWPPQKGFEALVRETTRTISNYHWAYEKYVLHLMEMGTESPLRTCLDRMPEKFSVEKTDHFPRDLALEVHRASRDLASSLGAAIVEFFGEELKQPQYDLRENSDVLNYSSLASDPALESARRRLHEYTCQALIHGAQATLMLTEWVLSR